MRKLTVFNSISLDGFFTDEHDDLTWVHEYGADREYGAWINDNAKSGGGVLAFGRKTYDMMVSYWPTAQAAKDMPVVAEGMNSAPKIVFSRTMDKATWNNTKLVNGDIVAAMKTLKSERGPDIVLMGSGQIVSLFASEGLIDSYTLPVVPVVLGAGRSMFAGIERPF